MKEKMIFMFVLCLCICFSCTEPVLTCNLTLECDPGGSTTPQGTVEVIKDQEFNISATPDQGYVFDEWTVTYGSGAAFGEITSAETTVILRENTVIYAHFSAMEPPRAKHEYAVVENYDQTAGEWGEITFVNEYQTPPVVVMGLISRNDTSRAHMRVKDVTVNGFSFKIDVWDNQNSPAEHGAETISYMVVEEGEHTLFDNTLRVLAGKFTGTREWETIVFPTSFPEVDTPVVVSQCMTFNHVDDFSVCTRQQNITNEGLDIKLQLSISNETNDTIVLSEEGGWIAFEMEYSSYPGMRFEIFRTPEVVDDNWYSLSFYNLYMHPPFFLPAMQTYEGSDTATVRSNYLSGTGVRFFMEEDPSTGDGGVHSPESVGYICIELD